MFRARPPRWALVLTLLGLFALGLMHSPSARGAPIACDVTALKSAITTANTANPVGGATIDLAAGCTYTLTTVDNNGINGLPLITASNGITINGNGATIQRSTAAGTPAFRIFEVRQYGQLTLDNVTVTGGSPSSGSGGGIYAYGNLTVRNGSSVSYNSSPGGGGGITAVGTCVLTVDSSGIDHNTSATGQGGGIYSLSAGVTISVTNSSVSANAGGGINAYHGMTVTGSHVDSNTRGQGIYSYGTGILAIENSTINNNRNTGPVSLGGGVYNGGAATGNTIIGSTIGGNAVGSATVTGYGGGIYNVNFKSLEVTNSLVENNTAMHGGLGGGIYNYGTLTLSGSTISGNQAPYLSPTSGTGGGIYNGRTMTVDRSTVSVNGAYRGAGIYNVNATANLILTNSTIIGNTTAGFSDTSGAGIYNYLSAQLTVTNVTITGNTSTYNGAGIYNWSGGLTTITSTTIAGNSTTLAGGGVYSSSATTTLRSTIVANNTAGSSVNCGKYGTGVIADGGYNLDSGTSCAFSSANNSLSNTDPLLGPLADNSGPTQTMALLTGSPAIDQIPINTNGCGTTITADQRGVTRPQGTSCDIGAFELSATPQADLAVTVSGSPDPVVAGSDLTYTIIVTNNGPSDASSVSLSDTLSSGTTFVSLTQNTGPTWTCTGGATVTCTIASLPNGASATFTLQVRVAPSVPDGSTLSNTVTVTGTTTDSNGANNSATVTTATIARADLAVAMVDEPDPVVAGDPVTYTTTVTNYGPSTASNVGLSDPLPAGTTFLPASSTPGWSFGPGNTGSYTVGNLAPGASVSVTLAALVSPSVLAGTTLDNTVTVTTTTTDPNPGNNSATVGTTVVSGPTVVTGAASNVTTTGATLAGTVTGDGGATVTACGVVYAPSSTPGLTLELGAPGTTTVPAASCTGAFSVNLSGLTPGTEYSYAAYATNVHDTGYGAIATVTTQFIPTVTPANATAQDVDASVTLSATVATNCATNGSCPVVNEGTVTFTVTDASDTTVGTAISGSVSGGGASASFAIPAGTAPGSYTITAAYHDTAGTFADSTGTATLTITPGPPSTLSLAPGTTTATVDTTVTETATVEDALGYPVANGTTVTFAVSGITTTSGSPTTTNGQASFSYSAILPGVDTLAATAQDGSYPSATATITWVLPASTHYASLGVANFTTPYIYGGVTTGSDGPSGTLTWRSSAVSFLTLRFTALVASGPNATLFGTATLSTGQPVTFRLDATGGIGGTVRLRLSDGYNSGTLHVLSVRVSP